MKSLFEQMGGTYREENGYLIPNLGLPDEEQHTIGIWGFGCPVDTSVEGRRSDRVGRRDQRHRRYLKENRKVLYADLLTSGKLNGYLADIDRQAEEMFSRLVKQMAETENITEGLKSTNPMMWVGKMNNIRNRVKEIVTTELIYT